MRDKVEEALMNTFNEPQPMVHCVKPFGRNPSLATFVRRHSGQEMQKDSTLAFITKAFNFQGQAKLETSLDQGAPRMSLNNFV